jgi:hypothetical protein
MRATLDDRKVREVKWNAPRQGLYMERFDIAAGTLPTESSNPLAMNFPE